MTSLSDAETPVVAAFDFDGTLTTGGSVWRFLVMMRGVRRVCGSALAMAPRLLLGALLGGAWADGAKEALFVRTLAGLDELDLMTRAERFGREHYRRCARPKVAARLAWHKSHGHYVLVVSASPWCYLKSVGEVIGADATLSTQLAVGPDGRLTGRYDGRNCRGTEKLARVREWMRTSLPANGVGEGANVPLLWAYGNSSGDLALLMGADVGVDVSRLGKLGRLRRFPRLAEVTADQ